MPLAPFDTPVARKGRGAFFTPPSIAAFLADWAVRNADAKVLDPTCGEAVFLQAAARRLRQSGASAEQIGDQLSGFDLHQPSLDDSAAILAEEDFRANLVQSDFFDVPTPAQIGDRVGWQDAVVGNPPFVRYQQFTGDARRKALAAALAQGVRLSQMASAWAPTLIHAAAFLKPEGRLAMVCPSELLTVHYAEPIRRWLRSRFGSVKLVMFEELQFADAEEQVVLLVAEGSGGTDGMVVHHVRDAADLAQAHVLDGVAATPAAEGKWSDLALTMGDRQLVKSVCTDRLVRLDDYGTPELGTVTGANSFFALSEAMRSEYDIAQRHLIRMSPPGTRHLKGLSFSRSGWEELRLAGERVWMLHPEGSPRAAGLKRYIREGEAAKVHEAYKCSIRDPWWRPPAVRAPDLFFTYMSHRYPRLITNTAGATLVNSMHGLVVGADLPTESRDALPLLVLNSATMVGAELLGRSYGGGILKMEPREAASLPVPSPEHLMEAWTKLRERRSEFDSALRRGEWWTVVGEVDRVLLGETLKLSADEVTALRDAATVMRVRRTRQTEVRG